MKKNCNRNHTQQRANLYTFARISSQNADKKFRARMNRLMDKMMSTKKEEVNEE